MKGGACFAIVVVCCSNLQVRFKILLVKRDFCMGIEGRRDKEDGDGDDGVDVKEETEKGVDDVGENAGTVLRRSSRRKVKRETDIVKDEDDEGSSREMDEDRDEDAEREGVGDKKAATVRRSIRKKQNRDSARRCRLRRKMQTADIFEMLKEQRDLILNLQNRISQLSETIVSESSGGGGVKNIERGAEVGTTSGNQEDKSASAREQGVMKGGADGLSVAAVAAAVGVNLPKSPASSGRRTSRVGGDVTAPSHESVAQGQQPKQTSVGRDHSVANNQRRDSSEEGSRSELANGTRSRKSLQGHDKQEDLEVVLQYDGRHLPDLAFLDNFQDEDDEDESN